MDVSLDDWLIEWLTRGLYNSFSRLDCIEQSLLIAKIGRISDADAEKVKKVWQNDVIPQF
jgi:mRNA interferase MazF